MAVVRPVGHAAARLPRTRVAPQLATHLAACAKAHVYFAVVKYPPVYGVEQ